MRDSILYSATRALVVTFCVVIGLCLGFVFITVFIGALSNNVTDGKLTTVNTEEILPNAEGNREILSSTSPIILQVNVNGVILKKTSASISTLPAELSLMPMEFFVPLGIIKKNIKFRSMLTSTDSALQEECILLLQLIKSLQVTQVSLEVLVSSPRLS